MVIYNNLHQIFKLKRKEIKKYIIHNHQIQ
jgi:hypothetical protein